ncbi:hypothetical protein EYF80_020983 [Liparis tanakae]|uniref:Uncharacterized protein n=1 Tax=Liparis tanakae TaxID=230148 RepID=A0A4Z2HTZ5_9TELE|nr:hypothetical protein EYF80_020983 [Liparis tanakae]
MLPGYQRDDYVDCISCFKSYAESDYGGGSYRIGLDLRSGVVLLRLNLSPQSPGEVAGDSPRKQAQSAPPSYRAAGGHVVKRTGLLELNSDLIPGSVQPLHDNRQCKNQHTVWS